MSGKIALLAALLFCGTAQAADLQMPDASRFGWDGAYVGVSAGYGWLKDTDYSFVPPLPDQGEDWIFGAHAGYLYGMGNFVVGAEVEATKLDITYEGFDFITIENAYTVRGRIGYSFDKFLVSAHGGASHLNANFMDLADWGWNAGAAVNYALTDHVTVGAQYDRYQFSEFDGTLIDGHIDTLTGRLGYKF